MRSSSSNFAKLFVIVSMFDSWFLGAVWILYLSNIWENPSIIDVNVYGVFWKRVSRFSQKLRVVNFMLVSPIAILLGAWCPVADNRDSTPPPAANYEGGGCVRRKRLFRKWLQLACVCSPAAVQRSRNRLSAFVAFLLARMCASRSRARLAVVYPRGRPISVTPICDKRLCYDRLWLPWLRLWLLHLPPFNSYGYR